MTFRKVVNMKQINSRILFLVSGFISVLLILVFSGKLRNIYTMHVDMVENILNQNKSRNVTSERLTKTCPYFNENDFLLKSVNPKKFLIYICDGICGGLGDRQKGIVAAYLMSLLTNRTFGIINTKPTNLNAFMRPNLVNWDVDQNLIKGLSWQYHNTLSGIKFLQELPNLDLNHFYSKDVILFRGNLEYVRALRKHYRAPEVFPKIMTMTNSDIYCVILKILFRFTEKLEQELQTFYSKYVKSRKLVCAHVRMGKNPTIPTDIKPKLRFDKIDGIWNFLKQYDISENVAIFVASDSVKVKKIAKRMFQSRYVDIPGKIVHIDQIGYRNETSGLKKMFLEQSVLSRCDVLLLTKSGFSRIAAYIRNHSNNLFCFVQGIVTPCRHDLLDQIYKIV